ncbi:hypothetical protein [Salinithrix halophila]|uniref:Uncharacterized protein n=1 Tax=Salinithrix halophila TaxID=1485204 RepID=A0ABV8JN09_9BACL
MKRIFAIVLALALMGVSFFGSNNVQAKDEREGEKIGRFDMPKVDTSRAKVLDQRVKRRKTKPNQL